MRSRHGWLIPQKSALEEKVVPLSMVQMESADNNACRGSPYTQGCTLDAKHNSKILMRKESDLGPNASVLRSDCGASVRNSDILSN